MHVLILLLLPCRSSPRDSFYRQGRDSFKFFNSYKEIVPLIFILEIEEKKNTVYGENILMKNSFYTYSFAWMLTLIEVDYSVTVIP